MKNKLKMVAGSAGLEDQKPASRKGSRKKSEQLQVTVPPEETEIVLLAWGKTQKFLIERSKGKGTDVTKQDVVSAAIRKFGTLGESEVIAAVTEVYDSKDS